MREDLVPQIFGEGGRHTGKDAEEVGLECADGTFGNVAAMDIGGGIQNFLIMSLKEMMELLKGLHHPWLIWVCRTLKFPKQEILHIENRL